MLTGVLTYNAPHRKTYDTLCLLRASGIENIVVYSVPLHYEKKSKPLYEHRPAVFESIPGPEELARNLGYQYVALDGTYSGITLEEGSLILICGAGILPDSLIEKYMIINAHPGYIPNVRGLDALKWAIYEGQPIGVTVHILGEEIDAGKILERKIVPVFSNDTFHSAARRQYEMEIEMLADSVCHPVKIQFETASQGYPLHKRMPASYEARLMERFAELVKNAPMS